MEGVGCGRREVFEPTLSIPDHERLFAERSHQGEGSRVAFEGASCENLASRAMLNKRCFQLSIQLSQAIAQTLLLCQGCGDQGAVIYSNADLQNALSERKIRLDSVSAKLHMEHL